MAESNGPPAEARSITSSGLVGKLVLSLAFGLLVFGALAAYADLNAMLAALGRFRWELLPAILGLTLLNYLLRFAKWHFYLGQIGVRNVRLIDSFLLFFSGLSMTVTPGKVGEWLKSFLLREISGTPFSRSAPIIVAERLSDGLAMLLLAVGGLVMFRMGWEVALAVLALTAGVVIVTQHRPLALRLLALGERLPVVAGQMRHLHVFYESSYTLFSPRNLALAVAVGFVSWSGECVAYYLVLVGLGLEPNALLLIQASFILATATLAGAVFLMPGGLGVAEGGLTALAQLLLAMPKDLAAVATLLIRFCTLWFGVGVGVISLLILSRRLASPTAFYLPSSSSSSSSSSSPSKNSSV